MRRSKLVHSHEGDTDAPAAKAASLEEHLRKLACPLLGDTRGFALAPLNGARIATISKRLLLSLIVSIVRPEGHQGFTAVSNLPGSACNSSNNNGNSMNPEDPSNNQQSPGSEVACNRSPTPVKRDEVKAARKKRGGVPPLATGNPSASEGLPAEGLLLRAFELADPVLSDILNAASKLDIAFRVDTQPTSETRATSNSGVDSASKGAASGHDLSSPARKKTTRQSNAPLQSAPSAAGSANSAEAIKEAVRAAQGAVNALPVSVHAELLWRVAGLKDSAHTAKIAKLWKALESRFIYT